MKKVVLILVAVVLVAGAAYSALVLKQPAANSPSNIKVPMTAERIERGKYIFENLADCGGCHSERNWEKFGAPVYEGRAGVGQAFPKEMGLPGSVVAPNLTPDPETGLGNWTDGEKLRAIREGVSKDGHALFPFMPYTKYKDMSDEDAQSVVAYLNSLPPVKNRVARTQLDFPVKYLVKFSPAPVTQPVPPPDKNNKVKYGEYLVKMGGCIDCHSQLDKGEPVKGKEYAGGFEFVDEVEAMRRGTLFMRVETRIVGREADHLREHGPPAVGVGHGQGHPATVRARIQRPGHRIGDIEAGDGIQQAVALADRQEGLQVEGRPVHVGAEQRDVDFLTLARGEAMEQGHHHTECEHHRGVHRAGARVDRRLSRLRQDRHHAGAGRGQFIDGRQARVRALRAETGQAAEDDPGTHRSGAGVVETERGQFIDREIRDDRVGARGQLPQQLPATIAPGVDGQALLVAVDEVGLVVPLAARRACLARQELDPDDPRAEIREQRGGQRGAILAGQIEHDHVVKGAAHGVSCRHPQRDGTHPRGSGIIASAPGTAIPHSDYEPSALARRGAVRRPAG